MASITNIEATDLITNSRANLNDNFSALNTDKVETSVLDTDTTLAANSDAKVATQKAVKAYVDATGGQTFLVPTGAVLPYGGATAPSNFLLCDGTEVSRSTYSTLFGVLSTTYGVGNGSTTFALPDMRSSFPVGAGQKTKLFTFVDANVTVGTDAIAVTANQYLYSGQAVVLSTTGTLPAGLSAGTYYIIYVSDTSVKLASSRANADDGTAVDITAAAGGGTHTLTLTLTNRVLGVDGGEESHTLQTEELASHYHLNNVDNGSGGSESLTPSGDDGVYSDNDTRTQATGGDTPHNNMPPFVVFNYIIKT